MAKKKSDLIVKLRISEKQLFRENFLIAVFGDMENKEVKKVGFIPFYSPYPQEYNDTILGLCNGIYLPDDSKVAVDMVDFAKRENIPIFYSIEELEAFPWKEQHSEFRKITNKMYHLHVKKNMDYSPANILGTGEIGVIVRMWDKMCRLMNLLGFEIEVKFKGFRETKEPKNESIEDSFLDSAVYAIIGLLYKRGKWGV